METRLRERRDDESDATPDVLPHQQRRVSVPDGWTHLSAEPAPEQVLETAIAAIR